MASTQAFADYCADLLRGLGPVRLKRMFGGYGIYVDDLFMAIIVADTLYLKVDATSVGEFEAAGCAPFVYSAKGRSKVSVNYRAAPAEALESAELMRMWATPAMQAALRSRGR